MRCGCRMLSAATVYEVWLLSYICYQLPQFMRCGCRMLSAATVYGVWLRRMLSAATVFGLGGGCHRMLSAVTLCGVGVAVVVCYEP